MNVTLFTCNTQRGDNKVKEMGQRDGLSYNDIKKIGRMYACERDQPIFNAVAAANPIISAIAGNVNSDRRFQFGRDIFNAYTSPQFWQQTLATVSNRLFNTWAFPQQSPRYQRFPQRNFNDFGYPYYGFGY